MKFIKVTNYGVFGTDNLTKDDLGRARRGQEDYILINRIAEEYFDPEANEWKPIQDIEQKEGDYYGN